jgi:hypothetical protein
MARCSCGGSTCSCVIQGGNGITVDGSGSSSSPYVIEATGEFEGSIIAVPTDTLLLTTSGEGTTASPLIISGRVSMVMTDLEDVFDNVGPQEGEVPVWTTDHWEFKTPASAPPGVVNRGAGIIGDGSAANPLMAATSGVWQQGDMAGFPTDSKLGDSVYTDSLGQLRSRPQPVVRHLAAETIDLVAGWTLVTAVWQQYGPVITVYLNITRSGSSIPSNANGDIGNVTIGTLKAAVPKPLHPVGMSLYDGSPAIVHIVSGTGLVQLSGLSPNVTLASGRNLTLSASYLANTGVVL